MLNSWKGERSEYRAVGLKTYAIVHTLTSNPLGENLARLFSTSPLSLPGFILEQSVGLHLLPTYNDWILKSQPVAYRDACTGDVVIGHLESEVYFAGLVLGEVERLVVHFQKIAFKVEYLDYPINDIQRYEVRRFRKIQFAFRKTLLQEYS